MAKLRLNVIGGGIAGLTAARLLSPHFVTNVYEKSGRLSGRSASLLFHGVVVDQGAPFFQLNDDTRKLLDPLMPGEIVQPPGIIKPEPNERQWYFQPSANVVGERLISNVDGITIHKRARVERNQDGKLVVNDVLLPNADAVLCTIPLPQAAELYPDLIDKNKALSKYRPTLLGVLAYEGITYDGIYARTYTEGPIELIALESAKPGRGGLENSAVFVVHGSESFSRKYLECDPEEWVSILRSSLEELWPSAKTAKFVGSRGKLWRYAQVSEGAEELKLKGSESGIFLAGDVFESGAGIDAAVVSGTRASKEILQSFQARL